MKDIKKKFEKIKTSTNEEKINSFLIDLVRNPDIEQLIFIDYFLSHRNPKIFDFIKLNLIYSIGEIGKLAKIDNKYIDFLIDLYFKSDRWVRKEILTGLEKIAEKTPLPPKTFEILKFALTDDYEPIKISALTLLLHFKMIPDSILLIIFKITSSAKPQTIELISRFTETFHVDEHRLFKVLSDSKNYRILDKNNFRAILSILFNSIEKIPQIQNLKDLILESEWEKDYKQFFNKEIKNILNILSGN
jgi:hypothetical protein